MSDKINLKEIEKKAYLSYHQDGLLDLFLGVAIILFGVGMATDQAYIGGIMPAILFPSWAAVKRAITLPRIGHVNFAPERKLRMKKEQIFFVIFFTITAVAGFAMFLAFGKMPEWLEAFLRKFILLPLGIIGAFGFSFLAYWKEMPRFYAMAVLLLIFIFAGPLLRIPHPVYFIALGIVFTLIGLFLFLRFLKDYPKVSGELS